MITVETLTSAAASTEDTHSGPAQPSIDASSPAETSWLKTTPDVVCRAVATPFGVRVDHLAADGEPLHSEYLPDSLAMPLSPGRPGHWKLVAWASVLAGLLGFGAGLLVGT
jgi:hypothetical protein